MTNKEAIRTLETECKGCYDEDKITLCNHDNCAIYKAIEALENTEENVVLTLKERALEAITKSIENVEIKIESTYHNEDMKEAAEAIFKLSQAFANINAFPLK